MQLHHSLCTPPLPNTACVKYKFTSKAKACSYSMQLNVNKLQLYRMSHVSQIYAKHLPVLANLQEETQLCQMLFSGNISLVFRLLRPLCCSLLTCSSSPISHLPRRVRPGGTAVPAPAHSGGSAASAATATAAARRYKEEGHDHIYDKHSSGLVCFCSLTHYKSSVKFYHEPHKLNNTDNISEKNHG